MAVQDDALSSTTNVYDNLNRLIQRWNGAGLIEGFGYDLDNGFIASTNSSGVLVTNRTADNADRAEEVSSLCPPREN